MDPMTSFDIRLVQYTAVQKMRAPLKYLSLHYNLDFSSTSEFSKN